ncbi:Cytoplasmic dynein 1 intermediate chain 2 [Anopheles sinensis]|uniref:Cytoplasmic dynein 1 intermediate chain 2 n=1 Tax=Anopheles sinensis TaxID=74873 RepID=A0A084WBU3_ANOSI|nr:Cytoplasmic dynein 1 intermediate chain 2 [Anopheles sinensis]
MFLSDSQRFNISCSQQDSPTGLLDGCGRSHPVRMGFCVSPRSTIATLRHAQSTILSSYKTRDTKRHWRVLGGADPSVLAGRGWFAVRFRASIYRMTVTTLATIGSKAALGDP